MSEKTASGYGGSWARDAAWRRGVSCQRVGLLQATWPSEEEGAWGWLQYTDKILYRQLLIPKVTSWNWIFVTLLSLSCFMHFLKKDPCRSFLKCLLEYSVSTPRSSDIAHHVPETAIETGHLQNSELWHGYIRTHCSTVCAHGFACISYSPSNNDCNT